MSWPDVDLHSYVAAPSAEWVYVAEVPEATWAINSTSGWAWDTLRIEPDRSVVPHLLFSDIATHLKSEHLLLGLRGSSRAIWNGPVSLSNPSLSLGAHHGEWLVYGSFTAPIGSHAEAPLHQPHWLGDVTASYGTDSLRATLGISVSDKAAFHAAVGYRLPKLRVEAYAQTFPARAEVSTAVEVSNRCWTAFPALVGGLIPGVGNAKLRAQLTIQYGCREDKSPEIQIHFPEPTPSLPPDTLPNAEPGKAGVFPSPRESISGFLSANETVIVFIRTNIPKEEADALITDLATNKGLPMGQIDHVEYVDAKPGEPGYLDFVVIKGNKTK